MDARVLAQAFFDRNTRRPSRSGASTPDITPFPIRLIHEKAPRRSHSSSSNDRKPQNDEFYRFWDRFLATSTRRSPHTSALSRRLEKTLKAASREEKGLRTQESPAASYEQAKKECQAKVQAIVAECKRLNQKYRDRMFDLELAQGDCVIPLVPQDSSIQEIEPSGVKRVQDIFEKPTFNAEGACGDDVMQGSLGNCWFIAALVSVSAKPGLMKRLCVARDESVGVYGFVFFRDGEWIPEVIDDRLFIHVSDGDDLFVGKYVEEKQTRSTFSNNNDVSKFRESLQKGGEALFFARCRDSQDTWLPLIEKAYAKAHGDYGSLHGGWVGEGLEDLTGGVSVNLVPSDVMDKSLLWTELMQVNETYLFAGGAYHYKEAGSFGKHAYAVLQAVEHNELRLLKIRNPWGNNKSSDSFDGPFNHKFEEWNAKLVEQLKFDFKDPGVFWVTLDNFLKYFESIQRTRLFDETWTLTQQWTSVNVPPGAITYLDTSFQITLSRSGPVVIVLAQPDVSYFQGLQGRYSYSLHFRLYNTKDTKRYIARSMHVSSGNFTSTRSVSVDLDLEAGTYNVLVKATPSRQAYPTAETVIETAAPYRKQKLLRVGRNFELAHAKGKLRDKEQDNRREKKEQERADLRDSQSKLRKLRQQAKAREKKRKDRIAEEKQRREKADLMKRASALLTPAAPTNLLNTENTKSTTYTGTDEDPNAELEDDDFEWDSEMDGETFDSDSDVEKDWFADDPWNAVCVLALRVYSQARDVGIKVCEGEEMVLSRTPSTISVTPSDKESRVDAAPEEGDAKKEEKSLETGDLGDGVGDKDKIAITDAEAKSLKDVVDSKTTGLDAQTESDKQLEMETKVKTPVEEKDGAEVMKGEDAKEEAGTKKPEEHTSEAQENGQVSQQKE